MSAKRKGDKQTGRSWFRTERLLQDGGKWFFLTREGKVEGPFSCRFDALNRLSEENGVTPGLTWVWPLVLDGAIVDREPWVADGSAV